MINPEESNFIIEIIKSPVLSAFIAAITATLISPYIKWGIEKKKDKRKKRSELLESVLNEIDNYYSYNRSGKENERIFINGFRTTDIYFDIKPYLSGDLQSKFRENDNSGDYDTILKLKEDIAYLKYKWGLI